MKWTLCFVTVLAMASGVVVATVCDEERCPDGYDCECTENYAEEIDSDVTVDEHQLIYSRDEWNKT